MDLDLWQRAERIFIECADLPELERERLLAQRCDGDADLLKLVTSLLAGDVPDDSVRDAIGFAASELEVSRRDRFVGMTVGPYTVETRIAEGGMGVVYRARRSDEQFEQTVAIKFLSTPLANDELRRRFRHERQVLANLQHPNIGMLMDGGETEGGVPFLVMEYVEGIPLDEYCDREGLDVEQRIALFRNVCAGVQYAHSNLVVHRDIKPSNILVTDDGMVKLLDFGIAKLVDAQADAGLTMAGDRIFTPRHASPEQVLGEPVTTATDVYALGLMLYEILTGAFPYDISSATSAGTFESVITGETPPRPSTVATPGVAKALRGDLDTIIGKCLRKRPEARYASVAELEADLDRYAKHLPVLARPPTLGYRLSRYWKRNRTATIGIAATLLAVVAGSTAATVGFFKAREAEQAAVAEARNAAAISEFLVSLFQEANPNNSAGNERSVRDILEIGRERVDTELSESPLTQAQVLETLSSVYKGLGDYERAEQLLGRAVTLQETHAPDDLVTTARMLNDLGDLARYQGRPEDAAGLIRSALDLHDRAEVEVSTARADAVNNLALVMGELGDYERSGELLEEALRLRQKLYDAPHPMIALSLHNLSWHYDNSGNYAEAERYALQAVEMRTAVFGEVHPRVGLTSGMLARIYRRQGKWLEAEAAARKSLAIAEKVFDTGHPDHAYAAVQLALVLETVGQLGEASDLMSRVIEWDRKNIGPDSYDYAMSCKARAGLLIDLGKYDEAVALLDEARNVFVELSRDRAVFDADTLLGTIAARTGRLETSRQTLDADIGAPTDGENLDSLQLERLRAIAELEYHAGNFPAALAMLADLIEPVRASEVTGIAVLLPELLHLQARSFFELDRHADAVAALETALELPDSVFPEGHWRRAALRNELDRVSL
jgi:serine/threonine protein kinase